MSAIVWIEVHDNKTMLPAPNDVMLVVIVLFQRLREDALPGVSFLRRIFECFNIRRTPWRPHPFHGHSQIDRQTGEHVSYTRY